MRRTNRERTPALIVLTRKSLILLCSAFSRSECETNVAVGGAVIMFGLCFPRECAQASQRSLNTTRVSCRAAGNAACPRRQRSRTDSLGRCGEVAIPSPLQVHPDLRTRLSRITASASGRLGRNLAGSNRRPTSVRSHGHGAGGRGVEPLHTDPESAVLPLDEPPISRQQLRELTEYHALVRRADRPKLYYRLTDPSNSAPRSVTSSSQPCR